jgi:hypothetical protein
MPTRCGGYIPLYRWHQEDNWRRVPGKHIFRTVTKALAFADEYLAKALNKLTGGPVDVQDDLGASQWKAGKQERHDSDRKAVFGQDKPSIVFPKGRKPVPVHYARRSV